MCQEWEGCWVAGVKGAVGSKVTEMRSKKHGGARPCGAFAAFIKVFRSRFQ